MAERRLHVLIVAVPEYPRLQSDVWERLDGVRNDAEELRSTLEGHSCLPIGLLNSLTLRVPPVRGRGRSPTL